MINKFYKYKLPPEYFEIKSRLKTLDYVFFVNLYKSKKIFIIEKILRMSLINYLIGIFDLKEESFLVINHLLTNEITKKFFIKKLKNFNSDKNPLLYACYFKNIKVIKLYLKYEIDLDQKIPYYYNLTIINFILFRNTFNINEMIDLFKFINYPHHYNNFIETKNIYHLKEFNNNIFTNYYKKSKEYYNKLNFLSHCPNNYINYKTEDIKKNWLNSFNNEELDYMFKELI